jgi:sodium pump decarboxylase gamma subunit
VILKFKESGGVAMNVACMSAETMNAVLATATALPSWFVVVMGMGIVFLGLICIVILCTIMSKVVRTFDKKTETAGTAVSAPATAPVPAEEPIANRQELVAAISVALAEELGKDVSAIRILSLKKV